MPTLAFCSAGCLISFSQGLLLGCLLAAGELMLNPLILCFYSLPPLPPFIFLSPNTTHKKKHTHTLTLNDASLHVNGDHSWQCLCGHAPQNRTHHRGKPGRPLREAESGRPHPGGERMLHHQQIPLWHRQPHQGGREYCHTTHHSWRRWVKTDSYQSFFLFQLGASSVHDSLSGMATYRSLQSRFKHIGTLCLQLLLQLLYWCLGVWLNFFMQRFVQPSGVIFSFPNDSVCLVPRFLFLHKMFNTDACGTFSCLKIRPNENLFFWGLG